MEAIEHGGAAAPPAAAASAWERSVVALSDAADRAGTFLSAIATVGFGVILLLGVFFRYVLNDSLVWTDEVALVVFNWAILLAIASGYLHDKHVNLDLVVRKLPPAWATRARVLAEGLALGFLARAVYGIQSWHQSSRWRAGCTPTRSAGRRDHPLLSRHPGGLPAHGPPLGAQEPPRRDRGGGCRQAAGRGHVLRPGDPARRTLRDRPAPRRRPARRSLRTHADRGAGGAVARDSWPPSTSAPSETPPSTSGPCRCTTGSTCWRSWPSRCSSWRGRSCTRRASPGTWWTSPRCWWGASAGGWGRPT